VPHPRQRLGAEGERAAADWYRQHGYQVVEQNWRCREGEIDLVVAHGRILVFCEVKTRSSDRFGTPAEAVTWTKQQKVRRVAARYLHDPPFRFRGLRFDVAVVDRRGVVEVIEAAF
jgi:putative endonuclease